MPGGGTQRVRWGEAIASRPDRERREMEGEHFIWEVLERSVKHRTDKLLAVLDVTLHTLVGCHGKNRVDGR